MDFNPLALPPEPGDRQKLITLTNFSFLNYFRRRSIGYQGYLIPLKKQKLC
ncbi:hypothetical protein [Cardinium endosymbiont of Tipula unca]|uniref:hypothetical protein n=1 Tax=Cardinium endosymbiont of Tipula unca TaxID=3066216 RepID=UPI0030D0746D